MDIKIIIEEMHQSLQEYNKYLRRKSFNSKNIPSLEYSSLHDYLLSYSIRPLTSNEIFDLIKKEGRIYFAKDRLGTKYDITEIVLEEIIASCNQYNEIIQYVIDKYKDNMDGIYFKYFHKQYPNLEYFCANPVIVLENILNENIDENKKKEKICAFFSLTRPLKLSEEHLKELKRLNINFTYFEQFIEANNGNKSRVYKNIFNETYFFNNDTNEDKKTILTAILYNATNSEALYQNIDLNCISRDEIIEFIKKYQTQKYISDETIFNVIKHMFLSEEEITKLDALAKKVKEEFLKYLDKTFFLDIDEFISEYNKQYKDNFNLFYFNKTQNKKLDQTTLIFLFTKDKDEDKYESFIVNNFLEKPNSDRISYTFESEIKDRLIRNEVRDRYQHVIKALNNNRQYTYRYHIKINVPEQYVDTFYKILEYYTKINHPSIANNTFVNTPQQNDNTYQCILERVQKQISNDFSKRKQWMDKYYEWIIYYIGENYISKEKWQENLANIEKDYYEKVGLKHLNKILAIPDQNKKKIVSYVNSKNKNLDYDILETLKVVIERHPEYRETIEKVLNFFEKYRKDNDILNNIIVNGIELTPEDVIKMFISGEYKNREIFLKNLNITLNTFNKFLTIVAETNPALIDLYNEKFEGMNSKRFAILIRTIEKIIDGITNGIVDESGKQRKFELLDYFTSTRLPIDDFIKLAKENYLITPENARYIKQFAAKVKEARKVPHTHIYNEKLIMIIDGQPHEVTMEEKKLALEYMKIYNIDLYYGIYKSLLKKVAHGELTNESLEELKQEKFQKQTQQSDTDETSKKI